MRSFIAAFIGMLIGLAPACANSSGGKPSRAAEYTSLPAVVAWVNDYRLKRDIDGVPAAMQALSRHGAFRESETAGVYVGFIAGIIGCNPAKAAALIERMFPIRPEDHWVLVRAIAYSGTPRWKDLLRQFAARMPERQVMIDKYLDGKLPTLDMLAIKPVPTTMEQLRVDLDRYFSGNRKPKMITLAPSRTVLDTLWGYYLASGSYGPIFRIIELLPWSKDKNHTDRLTVGSMAKYTLASNAARDPDLLAMLKSARKAREQSKEVVGLINEVIEAAEIADAGRIRAESLDAIETLKTKGPAYKREMTTWAKVGQGAMALGCIAAAVTGHVELGLPCVVGGGLSSAAMYYWNDQ